MLVVLCADHMQSSTFVNVLRIHIICIGHMSCGISAKQINLIMCCADGGAAELLEGRGACSGAAHDLRRVAHDAADGRI